VDRRRSDDPGRARAPGDAGAGSFGSYVLVMKHGAHPCLRATFGCPREAASRTAMAWSLPSHETSTVGRPGDFGSPIQTERTRRVARPREDGWRASPWSHVDRRTAKDGEETRTKRTCTARERHVSNRELLGDGREGSALVVRTSELVLARLARTIAACKSTGTISGTTHHNVQARLLRR